MGSGFDEHLPGDEAHSASGNLMDSKTSHLDDILKEKIEQAFQSHSGGYSTPDIAKIACEHSPIDLAYAASKFPPNARLVIFETLNSCEDKITFITETDRTTRVIILRHVREQVLKELFDKMSDDAAVFAMDDMSDRKARRVLDIIDPSKALRIQELREHSRNTAARIMTNEYFSFPMEMKIEEVVTIIRMSPGVELTQSIFVVNKKRELQGYVSSRSLIISSPQLTLKQVMREVSHKVDEDASREEVVDLVERYKISELPVVDEEGKLVGVVTSEEVIEAMEDIADDTVARFAGTAEKMGETESIRKRLMLRFPWLFVTLLAGILNGGVMSSFEHRASGALTFVLFFVPLITGLSGNIGIQCSTILVRGMATGALSAGGKKSAVMKELQIGSLAGLLFGFLSFAIVYMLENIGLILLPVSPVCVGLIIAVGLVGACFAGTTLGVLSPLFFARIGIDPAVSAGPIITAFNDFLSMAIYFIIALGLSAILL